MKRNQIIKTFNDRKNEGAIKMNKNLENMNVQEVPILLKCGDVRLEELEPTLRKEVQFFGYKKI